MPHQTDVVAQTVVVMGMNGRGEVELGIEKGGEDKHGRTSHTLLPHLGITDIRLTSVTTREFGMGSMRGNSAVWIALLEADGANSRRSTCTRPAKPSTR